MFKKNIRRNTVKAGRALPTVFVFLASVIWGSTFVTQKIAGFYMGSFTYNGARFLLGALSMLPVILFFERKPQGKAGRTFLAGIAGGIVLFIASNLQQFGIVLNKDPGSAGEAGFITGLYIVFTPILGLAFGRKTNPLTWIAAIIAFSGLALMSIGPEGLSSLKTGDILLVIGAFFWALHILLIDYFALNVSPLRFTALQFTVSGILSVIAAFSFETVTIHGLTSGILPLLYGGVFACGTGYTFQILGQRGVTPAKAAIIFSFEAVFAAVCETVFLREMMTPREYLGAAVIFIGILLSQIKITGKKLPN